MSKDGQQVQIAGLDEENLQKASSIYKGAKEGEVMLPEDDLDFDENGFESGATWVLNLVATTATLIEKEVEERGLSKEVASQAIKNSLNDALAGMSDGSLVKAYQSNGGEIIKAAAKEAVKRARKSVNNEVVGPN